MSSAELRRKGFKKGVSAEEGRRKREDNLIELRKNKRDENLQKKRLVQVPEGFAMEDSNRSGVAVQQKVRPAAAGARSARLRPPDPRLTRGAPARAAGEPARDGARRVVRGPAAAARGDHAVPQAALHRCVRPAHTRYAWVRRGQGAGAAAAPG